MLVDLNDTFKLVFDDLELVIHGKKAIIQIETMPAIRAIPLQMQQLFYNLLNNALKFSRPGEPPLVEITAREVYAHEIKSGVTPHDKQYVEITVKDYGIGFEQKYADQIFVMFQRLNDRTQFEGTGIGLSLCKKVVDNHSGLIFVTATPNEGATFRIVLPKN